MRTAFLAFLFCIAALFGCSDSDGPVRTVVRSDTLYVDTEGVVQISSKRGGVRVFVNGNLLGASPVEVSVAPGDTVTVRIE